MIPIQKARKQGGRNPVGGNQPSAQSFEFPAPVSGWFDNQQVSAEIGMTVAENVFVTDRGVRLRGGYVKVAEVPDAVLSLFSFTTPSLDKMFAATETGIYDVTGFDPDTVATASVTGQTGGLYSTAQFTTVGGQYLFAVNGRDNLQLFDGTTWAEVSETTPLAITGVDTSVFSYAWVHKNRAWFIEGGSNRAWYLPVDSIAGEASDLSLDGVFQESSSLLFGATLSQDSGSGMDDRLVLVSSLGEVAVYQGSNPANAADWSLIGVYKMDRPLGPNAHIRAGGDVLVATASGMVSIFAVMAKDPAALSAAAVSAPIRNAWDLAVDETDLRPWEVVKWLDENMILVSPPGADSFVANGTSGAWSKYTGWDAGPVAIHNRQLYFGKDNGEICQGERGGSDDGAEYVCRMEIAPNDLGANGMFKMFSMCRAMFIHSTPFKARLSVSVDYDLGFPTAPAAEPVTATDMAVWDGGLWDDAEWDDFSLPVRTTSVTGWRALGQNGFVVAPQIQVACNSDVRPDVEFMLMRVVYNVGGLDL